MDLQHKTYPKELLTKNVSLFMQPSLLKVYRTVAKQKKVPVSRLLRQAIEQYSETVL
jgi:hypothetical protein